MPKYNVFVKMTHLGKFVIEAEDEDHVNQIMDSGEVMDDECVNIQSVDSEVTKIELADQPPFQGLETPRIPEAEFEDITPEEKTISAKNTIDK